MIVASHEGECESPECWRGIRLLSFDGSMAPALDDTHGPRPKKDDTHKSRSAHPGRWLKDTKVRSRLSGA